MDADRPSERSLGANADAGKVFAYFNEIGIIAQLSGALLARVLPDGVHPSHFFILNHLVRMGDGKTPLSIAAAMQVTKATMSHSLAVLEKRGFIETRPSATDARSKQVFLTQPGRAFQIEAVSAATLAFQRILGEGDRKIMAESLPGLAAIRKLLDEHRDATPG
ncbi:transcriptional regulator, MarR family [Hoeflea sp. IMCC20628]|uniref:MarR family winged helix-turn-helix transcriptional regulator n=1 Tax=Hoeflea sp. IMCC20628 TaxID=1620421 RepID=UPI00063B034F|nr:MarR family transcriptional regulator [Hoeflea sp. IMCC20628]AKI02547.1 transcriptional regulator, MarR family [Hoeflea sp. IMCC20628]